jgi:hypothetical protein
MAAPKPNVTVLTEVGYCPFCGRTRNLRREERHLGALVRTSIDCESCHRTLSSTIGPPVDTPEPEPEPEKEPQAEPVKAPAKRTRAKAAASSKPAAKKKPAAKTATAKKSTTKKK